MTIVIMALDNMAVPPIPTSSSMYNHLLMDHVVLMDHVILILSSLAM